MPEIPAQKVIDHPVLRIWKTPKSTRDIQIYLQKFYPTKGSTTPGRAGMSRDVHRNGKAVGSTCFFIFKVGNLELSESPNEALN